MLDVDTKDIRLLATNPKTFWATHLLEKELRTWLKTSKFANVLNQIADEAPKYGSVVIEKVNKGAKVVDLRKLILDPTVDNIKDSRFVTTIHYMTPTELRNSGWDKTAIEAAILRFGNSDARSSYEDQSGTLNQLKSTPYIKVTKRYGEVPKWWIDGGKSEEMVKALFIVAGADVMEKNTEGKIVGEAGVVLFKSRWYKDWPFKDFHYNKINGRWLGLGIVEALFDTQVRLNELKNQKRISMEVSTIHLFQTKDKQIIRNIVTDLESGDLLQSPNGIEPIANEERNLAAFDSEEQSYIQQAQRLSFAYDAVSGETSAASTTATAVMNAQQQATSTFGFKKENFTNMLRDFFNDDVMPVLIQDLSQEHIMRYTGNTQELRKLDEAMAELHGNDIFKKVMLSGQVPTPENIEAEKARALTEYKKLGEARFLKIKEFFYKDAEYKFDFNVGNEQINPQALATNTQALLASYNSQAMNDPRYKLLYFKYADSLGVSQGEIEAADTEAKDIMETNPQALGIEPPAVGVEAEPSLATNQ
jgi:hypothetical protein